MSGTEYTRPSYGIADLEPSQADERAIMEVLRQRRLQLDQFREGVHGAGEILTMRYRRPVGLQRHRVESTADPTQTVDLPATVKQAAFVPNQRVVVARTRTGATIIGHPPPGELAISERPTAQRTDTHDAIMIERIDPVELPAGATTSVTVYGLGFASSPVDVFEAVVFNEATLTDDADTFVTAGVAVYVSATSVTLPLTVTSSAPIGHSISLKVTRG